MANTLSTRIDQDFLYSLPRDQIIRDASSLLEPLKNERGEQLVAATAVLFAIMAERYSGSAEGLYEFGKRVLRTREAHHTKGYDETEALRDFAALRISQNPTI